MIPLIIFRTWQCSAEQAISHEHHRGKPIEVLHASLRERNKERGNGSVISVDQHKTKSYSSQITRHDSRHNHKT